MRESVALDAAMEADLGSADREQLYEFQQLAGVQGLLQISLGAEHSRTFFNVPVRRQKYHGNVPRGRVRFKSFNELIAAQVRHVHIDENEVRRGTQGKVPAYDAVLSEQDGKAGLFNCRFTKASIEVSSSMTRIFAGE